MKGRKILRRLFPILSAYYFQLDMFGLIDAPNPKWAGWFVATFFTGVGQAVVGAMVVLGNNQHRLPSPETRC